MPNVSELLESDYVTVDLVKNSPSKKATLLNEGSIVPGMDGTGERLQMVVEIDGKRKQYTPNKTSIKQLKSVWGGDTKNWVGKTVNLSIQLINGNEAIIAQAADKPQHVTN